MRIYKRERGSEKERYEVSTHLLDLGIFPLSMKNTSINRRFDRERGGIHMENKLHNTTEL